MRQATARGEAPVRPPRHAFSRRVGVHAMYGLGMGSGGLHGDAQFARWRPGCPWRRFACVSAGTRAMERGPMNAADRRPAPEEPDVGR